MNDQYDNPVIVERTANDMNSPEVNPEPFTDKVPVEADLTQEAPKNETYNFETPTEEKVVQAMPMGETIVHETPMNVTIAHEAPVGEAIVHETLLSETIAPKDPVATNLVSSASLLNREESEQFRTRWNEIQGKFVDEPRSAVEQADKLVTEVIGLITEMFSNEHRSLEAQWNKGSDVSTEDLRVVLQRYRSFFNSLVV